MGMPVQKGGQMGGIAGFCNGIELVALLPRKVQRPHDVSRKESQRLAGTLGPCGNDRSYAKRYQSFINSSCEILLTAEVIKPPAIFSMSFKKLTTCRMLVSCTRSQLKPALVMTDTLPSPLDPRAPPENWLYHRAQRAISKCSTHRCLQSSL